LAKSEKIGSNGLAKGLGISINLASMSFGFAHGVLQVQILECG
jgi:hypothetical protein